MRLQNNEITLSRRERKVLGAPSRHVAAAAIGQLWRHAVASVADRKERLDIPVSTLDVIPGLGPVAAHSSEYYELKRLDKQQQRLDGMEHIALAIEMETT